jgi:hypothetical protein
VFVVIAFDAEHVICQHPQHGSISLMRADVEGGGE